MLLVAIRCNVTVTYYVEINSSVLGLVDVCTAVCVFIHMWMCLLACDRAAVNNP